MNNKMFYGVQFYRHPGPDIEQLMKDMEIMKDSGFDSIRVQQVWSYEEPYEGVYNFDKIRSIIKNAEEIGMDVVVTLTLECAPPWLYKNQDVFQRNAYGEIIKETTPYPLPADGKPGPCWDNPVAKDAAELFVKAFIEDIGCSIAVKGWGVWQEAGIWARQDSRGMGATSYCYCDHTILHFQQWLESKYKTLDKLNKTLMTNYYNWAFIQPPNGFMNSLMCPLGFAFCCFMRERMDYITGWKKDIVRKYDKHQRPVMCHTVNSMLDSGIGGKWDDDYILSSNMDIYGKSLYPMWGYERNPNQYMKGLSYAIDTCRCAAGKEVWAAELQAGRPGSGVKRWTQPKKEDLQNWTLAVTANGSKGLVYWQCREEIILHEAYGHGLLNRRGEPQPQLLGITEVLAFIKENEDIIMPGVPEKREIAIAINADSHILAYLSECENLVVKSVKNIYWSLLEKKIRTDFIWKEEILKGNLDNYKIVFLPFPLSMTKEYAEKIQEYVKNGGVIISEACPATYNNLGNATSYSPDYNLHEVFGCYEKEVFEPMDYRVVAKENETMKLCGEGICEGLEVKVEQFLQIFNITSGNLIFKFRDEASGVMNYYGKGRAYIVGTMFTQTMDNAGLLIKLLDEEGIKADLDTCFMVQKLASDKGMALFVYNEGETQEVWNKEIPIGYNLRSNFGSQVICEDGTISAKINPGICACFILEKQ